MTSVMNTGIGRRLALLLGLIVGALALSSGVALAATMTCATEIDCVGTNGADTLEGTAGKDIMHARAGADTLKGFANVDLLYGQGGTDTLLGGPDHDSLIGGVGNDALKGGGGADAYYFGDGWGRDSITDTAAPGTEVRFDSDVDAEAYVTDNVIVDLISGAGPEAKDASGTNTINWDGSVVDTVYGGNGDDQITGNASANLILGDGGSDTVYGGEGDDDIHVYDGYATDTVHCGPGEDTVSFDVGPYGVVSDLIAKDCEHLDAHNDEI